MQLLEKKVRRRCDSAPERISVLQIEVRREHEGGSIRAYTHVFMSSSKGLKIVFSMSRPWPLNQITREKNQPSHSLILQLSALREVAIAREIHEAGVPDMQYLYMGERAQCMLSVVE